MCGLKDVTPPPDFIKNVNARLDGSSLWQRLQQQAKVLWQVPVHWRAAAVAPAEEQRRDLAT
jgi:hypothetical protein